MIVRSARLIIFNFKNLPLLDALLVAFLTCIGANNFSPAAEMLLPPFGKVAGIQQKNANEYLGIL